MFDIKHITIRNFKSYAGIHKFEFPDDPGVYYFTGVNNYNKRLGTNGIGKTSFIDAIQWCLYGRTSKGLRATDIITWNKKSTYVKLKLEIANEEVLIKRSQNPNGIWINKDKVSQDEINQLLRIDQESFNFTIVIPSFGDSFFDLKPTSKLNLFSQIMKLDYWIEKSNKASEISSQFEDSITRLESIIGNTENKIELIKSEIKNYKVESESFENEKQEYIKQLQLDIVNKKLEYKKIDDKPNKISAKIKKLRKTRKKYRSILDEVEQCNKELQSKKNEIEYSISQLKNEIRNLNDEKNKIKNLKSKTCPKCHQQVKVSHVKNHIKEIENHIDNQGIYIEDLYIKVNKIEEQLDKVNTKLKLKKDKLSKIDEKFNDYHIEKRTADYNKSNIKNQIEDIKKRIKHEKQKTNKFEDLVKSKGLDLKKQQIKLKKNKDTLIKNQTELESTKFWVNGFKRVRLFVVEQALDLLEVEVNNNFISLGLEDWEVKFDIERETKSGNISSGFSVFIKNKASKKSVRWEAYSGGETQRLRLAGDLGLSNLILEKNGLEGKIEFFDEPSDHMSQEGIEDMVSTLYQRAHLLKKKIWLVDHQTINFGDFNGILKVTTNSKNHSSFKYEEL